MTCESECGDTAATDSNGSDSEEKWDDSEKSGVMTPLKPALKKRFGENKGRRVTFSATTTVYSDDLPEGFLEPMKGAVMCLAFDPPPEYQDCELLAEFQDSDSESDWFPVISVNQQCSGDNSSDEDSDDWDVLQCSEDNPCLTLNMEEINLEDDDGTRELDSESSDSSQDTIILLSPDKDEPTECNEQNVDLSEINNDSIVQTPECLKSGDQTIVALESDNGEFEDNGLISVLQEETQASVLQEEEEKVLSVLQEQTRASVLQEEEEKVLSILQEESVLEMASKEQETESKCEGEDHVYSKTSDIRRKIAQSATMRNLLRGAEARKRQSPSSQHRNSTSDCLSEKLRWLACPETLWDNEVTVPPDVREWKVETAAKSDELEQFVEQYITRIERIRRRYSLTDLGFVRYPSVRGIKPRFGSTTEILQQLQSQIRPHPLAGNRHELTWPSHRNSYCGDEVPSCGIKEERGVPEGASSSPIVSSDSLECEPSCEGFIYYSLNV